MEKPPSKTTWRSFLQRFRLQCHGLNHQLGTVDFFAWYFSCMNDVEKGLVALAGHNRYSGASHDSLFLFFRIISRRG